jgi:hypothetical protein
MLCRLGKILCCVSLTGGLLASSSGASALCVYGGKHFTKAKDSDGSDRGLYATTSLADEFQDSVLVVKGTVLSSRNIELDPANESGSGTVFRVRIDQIFKEKALAVITDYTDRDSGGFYLGEDGAGPESSPPTPTRSITTAASRVLGRTSHRKTGTN